MRVFPAEIRMVSKLLDSPADSADELARQILEAVAESQAKRAAWVVVTQDAAGMVVAWGPYPTLKQAQKAIGKEVIASREGTRGMYLKCVTSSAELLEEDENAEG